MKGLLHLVLLIAGIDSAQAQGDLEAILNFSTSGGGPLQGTAGWSFQALAPLTVTSLGCLQSIVDTQGNIQVGLWASNGTLLAQAVVTGNNTIFNQSRYQSITPVKLITGQTYTVGAYSSSGTITVYLIDPSVGYPGTVTTASSLQLLGAADGTTGFTKPPTVGSLGTIDLGANFLFTLPAPLTPIRIAAINYSPTGVQLQWSMPDRSTNHFQVQWTPALSPAQWHPFTNTFQSVDTFLDNGSQTAGLGPARYYRLMQLP